MKQYSRLSVYQRKLKIDLKGNNAFFIWGPRKTGKTTFLKTHFPSAHIYDLLNNRLKTRLMIHPETLREEILGNKYEIVIIDEIQKVPSLLDEVHWCLENTETKFILSGSSARKMKKGAANLLGGRAWRYEMFPLTTAEIPDFDIMRALNHGLIPQHYKSDKPEKFLESYLLDYINEEIQSEALVRNIGSFSLFLESAGTHHGQLLNYANIARECGVTGKTVREYFQILEDTLLGYTLKPWTRSTKRRLIETAKFYFFDPGIVRAMNSMRIIQKGTEELGRSFEHFIINEVRAFLSYNKKYLTITYWRTSTGLEVDLIVGNLDIAIEIKSSDHIRLQDIRGLTALCEEQKIGKAIVVSFDKEKKLLNNNIHVMPWTMFCSDLWNGKIISL